MTIYASSPMASVSDTISTTASTVYTLYDNTHTVIVSNSGAGDILLYFTTLDTPFNLNGIVSQCWELKSGEMVTLNVDTATDRPGGRNLHLCATTAGGTAVAYTTQLVQNSL